MSRWSVAIPEPGGSVSQIREVLFTKCHFLNFLPNLQLKWWGVENNRKIAKNAFYWLKLKKVKKADPSYFLILHKNMSPNFFWGPPGQRKWHFLKKPDLSDFADTSPWLRDGHWPLGNVSHLGAIFLTKELIVDSCVLLTFVHWLQDSLLSYICSYSWD